MSAPPKKTSLSLYADLLEPNKQKTQGATISGAPVKYDVKKANGDDEVARKKDASLKFQPIKRPQVQQKSKAKPATSSSSVHKFSSSTVTASVSSPDKQLSTPTPAQQPGVQKSNFEDWVGDEDDDYYYQDRPKHERGGRKKRKKNKPQERVWDWDDIYDPTLPNTYADYKGSDEQYREIRDWKARLYYHQLKEAKKAGKSEAAGSSDEEADTRERPMNRMFAPPSGLNFAPPSFDEDARSPRMEDDDDYYRRAASSNDRRDSDASEPPASFAQVSVPDDATGEDAYMRRMRMSGMVPEQAVPQPPPPPQDVPTPPPQSVVQKPDNDLDAKRAEAQAKIAAFKAKLGKPTATSASPPNAPFAGTPPVPIQPSLSPAPPPPPPPPPAADDSGATISRAPVRYQLPPPPADMPEDENTIMADAEEQQRQQQHVPQSSEESRTSRPGQKGFAERLLKKYGWEKGQGLGAQGEGITTALIGKADKRKKVSDAEGGGWAQPKNMGKIVGGKRRKLASTEEGEDSQHGQLSEVVKLTGMLTGLDVQKEIEDNNLMQEIGDEMGRQYGNVERVFIWREAMGGRNEVFVKFTSQLSALRAVNATDGMTFAGNDVAAEFWDAQKFEGGEYA